MFGLGSPLGDIIGYAGVMAKKHNFALRAMEFLALPEGRNSVNLVEWIRTLRVRRWG